MSEATPAAPAPGAPATAPATAPAAPAPAARETPKTRLDKARGVLDRNTAARAAASAPPAPAPAAPASPASPAAPAPAPNADGEIHRLRNSAMEHDRKRQDAEKRVGELEKKLQESGDLRERLKKDPHSVLIEAGVDVQAYLQAIAEGKFKPKSPEQLAAEENKTELQKALDRIDALEREKADARAADERRAKATQLKEELTKNVEHFPLANAMPWAAEHILGAAGEAGDYNGAAQALEAAILDDVKGVMLSDTALGFLLKDPEIRGKLEAHFKPAPTPTDDKPDQQAKGSLLSPRTLTTEVTASAATPGGPRPKTTDSDRRRAAMRRAETIFARK